MKAYTKPVLAALAAVGLWLTSTSLAQPQTPPTCGGEPCYADVVYFATANWTINPISHDGQGVSQEYVCEPCRSCDSGVAWVYTGPGLTFVTYPGGFGTGNSGAFTLYTPCDGIPPQVTFWDSVNGQFALHLYCLCAS